VIHSYNKSQRDALISQIYFCKELYMFRTDLLSEACRVLYQNKVEKLVHLFGFYYKNVRIVSTAQFPCHRFVSGFKVM